MSEAAPKVAVVTVLHDSGTTLADCVQRVLAQPGVCELILVDNASRDGWRAQLPDDPRIRCLVNPDNPGFAVACNQGAAASRADWLLFLNPDCLLPEGALAKLLEVAQGRPGPGLLGAQLLEADGRLQPASRRLAPTPARLLRGRLDLPPPAWAHDPSRAPQFEPLEAISGALMLLPRRLFEAVGGFDTGYRLHCEDLDLCRRIHRAGHWVGIAPRVQVVHLKGTSSRRRPFWVEWQKHHGMWRYFNAFDRAGSARWVAAAVLAGLLARLPLAALRAWIRELSRGR